MLAGRNQFCEGGWNTDDRSPRKLEPDNASQRCEHCHDREKRQNGSAQMQNRNGRRTVRLRNQCEDNAQKGTDADRCGNAPADSEDRRRGCVKQWRVPNRKVFDAEPGRNLIVDDAVGDCGGSAEQNNFCFSHASQCSTCLRILGRLGFGHGRTDPSRYLYTDLLEKGMPQVGHSPSWSLV